MSVSDKYFKLNTGTPKVMSSLLMLFPLLVSVTMIK